VKQDANYLILFVKSIMANIVIKTRSAQCSLNRFGSCFLTLKILPWVAICTGTLM